MSLRFRVPAWLRVAVTLGLLAFVASRIDLAALGGRLAALDPAWAALALAVSLPQFLLSAWRWRFTADRLGVGLPYGRAVAEYYLGSFLNQVLPGGVVGDAARAWRHGSERSGSGVPDGRAVRAVILERASGQVVMAIVAVASVLRLPLGPDVRAAVLAATLLSVLAAVALAAVAWRRLAARPAGEGPLSRLVAEARIALLARDAWPAQLLGSTLVVATYLAMFVAAARAVGVQTPIASLLPLVAPVLVAMLIPVSVAGWGLREGAAAVIWPLAGLPAADGVAASVAYGALVLLSTCPGALLLLPGLPRRSRSNSTSSPSRKRR